MEVESKEPKRRSSRTSYIKVLLAWLVFTGIVVGIQIGVGQRTVLAIEVVGLSIVLSAVLLKYLDVYEQWLAQKEDIRREVEEMSKLVDKLDVKNVDSGDRA